MGLAAPRGERDLLHPGALPPDVSGAVIQALSNSIQTAFLVAVPVLLVGFALSWLLREIPVRDDVNVGGGSTMEGAGESLAATLEPASDPGHAPELVGPAGLTLDGRAPGRACALVDAARRPGSHGTPGPYYAPGLRRHRAAIRG